MRKQYLHNYAAPEKEHQATAQIKFNLIVAGCISGPRLEWPLEKQRNSGTAAESATATGESDKAA
jgi:hypothetical protein